MSNSNETAQVEGKHSEGGRSYPTFYLHSPEPEAERLADALLHSCTARERAVNVDGSSCWRCETCGAVRAVRWGESAEWLSARRDWR